MNPLAPIGHVAVAVAVNPVSNASAVSEERILDKLVSKHGSDHITAVLVEAAEIGTFDVARRVRSNTAASSQTSPGGRISTDRSAHSEVTHFDTHVSALHGGGRPPGFGPSRAHGNHPGPIKRPRTSD